MEYHSTEPITVVKVSMPNNLTRSEYKDAGIENAIKAGRKIGENMASVYVKDIDTEVRLSRNALSHGMDRRTKTGNGQAASVIGDLLANSILINELTPDDPNYTDTFVLLGAADIDGRLTVAEMIVNRLTNELQDYVFHSVHAKKESAGINSPGLSQPRITRTDSTISVEDFLDIVNSEFPDILPEDVLKHYGHTQRPEGEKGKDALFSRDLSSGELYEANRQLE